MFRGWELGAAGAGAVPLAHAARERISLALDELPEAAAKGERRLDDDAAGVKQGLGEGPLT